MISPDSLLEKARNEQRETKNKAGTFRKSGDILEDRHKLLYPEHKKYPPKSPFDFHYNGYDIDIKGCWASDYNECIFIEKLQNPRTNTTPAYMKPENLNNGNIFLCFVDYNNGKEYWIHWKTLYQQIKDLPVIKGGDSAYGWKINIKQYSTAIRIKQWRVNEC